MKLRNASLRLRKKLDGYTRAHRNCFRFRYTQGCRVSSSWLYSNHPPRITGKSSSAPISRKQASLSKESSTSSTVDLLNSAAGTRIPQLNRSPPFLSQKPPQNSAPEEQAVQNPGNAVVFILSRLLTSLMMQPSPRFSAVISRP